MSTRVQPESITILSTYTPYTVPSLLLVLVQVKFFGDWQLEKVVLSGLEPFEASFRKLFKKRYEKVGSLLPPSLSSLLPFP
jgi:hypothetical protein